MLLTGNCQTLVFAGVNEFGLGMVVAPDVLAAQWALATHTAARAVRGCDLGVDDHGLAILEQAGAQVVVFVVQEEPLVKKLSAKGTHAQQHGGAAHKPNAGWAVGYGRATAVPHQMGPAVVDFRGAFGLQQLRCHHGGLWPLVGGIQKLSNRLWGDFAIRIEQQGKRRLNLCQSPVVRGPKAQIVGKCNDLGVRQVLPHGLHAAIVAAIVHNGDVRTASQQSTQFGQAMGAVESDDHDRHVLQHGLIGNGGRAVCHGVQWWCPTTSPAFSLYTVPQ